MATILIVDDSISMRQMLRAILVEAEHEVVEAVDGKEAMEKIKQQQFDLVISDINMPRMDGITLVKELRALQEYKLTPIIILTTEANKNIKQEAKTAGATGWIVKPFNPQQLLAAAEKAMKL